VKKRNPRFPLLTSLIVLLLAASLMTGCYRSANPDVTDTPAGGAQTEQEEESTTPDIQATAFANSTRSAQTEETPEEEEEEEEITASPTPQPPTPTPPPTETSVATTAVPTFTPAPTEEEAAPTPEPSTFETKAHTVQAGENMFRIALRYDTTVQAIANANGIANPALIYVGQVLTIPEPGDAPSPAPGGTTYVVQPGDNLFRIALKYNMSYTYLAQYNNIANPSNIYVGQTLRIP
jgi:LysM repeat protein